ncbi:hypothetical protein HMPREF9374_0071 [Desmospora sp. 8437]|nr:hypothetical protein HMPREF9374_0071 [Desmospora sp. 8437]
MESSRSSREAGENAKATEVGFTQLIGLVSGGKWSPSENLPGPLKHCEKVIHREGWVSHGVILDRKNNENDM